MRSIYLTILLSYNADAYDPYTIAVGAKAASDIFNSTAGKAAGEALEAAETAQAVADLLVELGLSDDADERSRAHVAKLETVIREAREVAGVADEVQMLAMTDLSEAKSILSKIQKVQGMAKSVKRLAGLFGYKPKAAERAVQFQAVQLNYMVLDELMALRRSEFERHLNSQKEEIRRKKLIGELLAEETKTNRRIP